jgi:hypothetical protein
MMCAGPASQTCGNCGMQMRTCDASTGQWSEWLECNGEGECKAGETAACGNGGTKTCESDCQWGTACMGQQCSGASMQACGNCGQQTRTCDPNTGQFMDWSACQGGGPCKPGENGLCGVNRIHTCTADCTWGPCDTCRAPLTDCSGICVNTRANDRMHCGSCSNECATGQECSGGDCVHSCPSATIECGADCCTRTQVCIPGGRCGCTGDTPRECYVPNVQNSGYCCREDQDCGSGACMN